MSCHRRFVDLPSRRRRAVLVGTLFLAAAAANVHPGSASASGFLKYSASNPDYPQKVDFVTACLEVKVAKDDPIVLPGQPGASHEHTFSGNVGVTAASTPESLATSATTCTMTRDHASYWLPSLQNNGRTVLPYTTRAYYRAGTTKGASVKPMPFGLRMVAGNPMAMAAQSASVAGFQCRNTLGNSVPKQALPPHCATGDFLEASVVFPNCWDGKNLDSIDHRSHTSYAVKFRCDAMHPVQIPQLTLAERFPVGKTQGTVTLASMNSPMTLHADFLNAWTPTVMQQLVTRCINAGRACADVSDRRFPPA